MPPPPPPHAASPSKLRGHAFGPVPPRVALDGVSAPSPPPRSLLVTQLIAVACLVVVNVTFGGYSVFTSAVLKHATLDAIVFAFLRDVLGTAVLMGLAFAAERRRPPAEYRFWPDREDTGQFVLVGLLGVWGSQGLSALAIANLTATFFSLMEPAMPVVTLSLSLLLGYEPFYARSGWSWGKLAGVAITVGGAVAMAALSSAGSGNDVVRDSKNFGLGVFFAVLQVTMGGTYSVAQKPLLAKYAPITVAA